MTRAFDHFMSIAHSIRRDEPAIRTIFIATDSFDVLERASESQWAAAHPPWRFIHSPSALRSRSATAARNWFAPSRSSVGPSTFLDIECLRRADYLVGSFQSNVFRLAAELNTVYHEERHHSRLSGQRIRSVDVNWYEDP